MLKQSCFILFFSALTCVQATAQGGKLILMKHADRLEYDTAVNQAQRLQGHVEFQHGIINLYCDSAWFFTLDNYITAYGHIHIKQGDSLNLYGDSLHYDGKTRLAKLRGHIRLVENDLHLATDSIDFNARKGTAFYSGGGVITSMRNKNTLTSRIGYYHSKTKNLYFKYEVRLTHPEYTLNADTLRYHVPSETAWFTGPSTILTKDHTIYTEAGWYDTRKQRCLLTKKGKVNKGNRVITADTLDYDNAHVQGSASGHIEFTDTTEDVTLKGDHAWYDEIKNEVRITKNPLMLRYFEKDTLYVGADTLFSTLPDSGMARVQAFHHVKIYKGNLQGVADSAVYNEQDSTLQFYNKPVLWYNENQLTSDHITFIVYNRVLNRAYFNNNCFIISKADTAGFNQLKGRNMTVFFQKNEMIRARVYGNGQAVYYMGEEGKPYAGINRTDCSDIELRMKDGKMDEILFITEPDATVYPLEDINPKDKLLKDFHWTPEKKPERFFDAPNRK